MLRHHLGADIHEYALEPEMNPTLFLLAIISKLCNQNIANIEYSLRLYKYIKSLKPDVILHLAAQSFVHNSWIEPLKIWKTNLMLTANLPNSLCQLQNKCAVVIATTQKVYKNLES